LFGSVVYGNVSSSSEPPPPAPFGYVAAPVAEPDPSDTPTVEELPPAPAISEPPATICKPRGIASGVSIPARSAFPSLITYSRQGSIWLYDVRDGRVHRLVKGNWEGPCSYYRPHFVSERLIEFEGAKHLAIVDIVSGRVTEFTASVPTPGWLGDLSLSRDGQYIAEIGGEGGSALHLAVTSSRSGGVLFSRKLGFVCACDGLAFDITLQWSSDSTLLLASLPTEGSYKVYVLDLHGRILRSVEGGYGKWMGSTHSFVYNQGNPQPTSAWYSIDASTGARHHLVSIPDLIQPAVSPDGQRVAFTDTARQRILMLDLRSLKTTVFGRGHAYPIWLTDGTFAEVGIKPCNCEGLPFDTTGTVYAFDISTGRSTRLTLAETAYDDVLF
jgi:hypothetical protein